MVVLVWLASWKMGYLRGAYGAYVYMHPNWKEAQMIRASTGKREYMDKEYVKEKNKVQVY